jgi:shikimate kinase
VEILWERVEGQPDRPLARGRQQFEQLYEQRSEVYAQADFTVYDEGAGPAAVVDAILNLRLV